MVQPRHCSPGSVRTRMGAKCTYQGEVRMVRACCLSGFFKCAPIHTASFEPCAHVHVHLFSYGNIIAVRHPHDHGRLAGNCKAQRNGSHGRRHQTRLLALLRRQTLNPVLKGIPGGIYVLGGKEGIDLAFS